MNRQARGGGNSNCRWTGFLIVAGQRVAAAEERSPNAASDAVVNADTVFIDDVAAGVGWHGAAPSLIRCATLALCSYQQKWTKYHNALDCQASGGEILRPGCWARAEAKRRANKRAVPTSVAASPGRVPVRTRRTVDVCHPPCLGVLDEEALLTICAYIDLNPVAAGIVEVPEESPHTSVTARVDHVKSQGRTGDLKAAQRGSVAGSTASAGLEETIWLCPVEDRRKLDSSRRRNGGRPAAGQLSAAGRLHGAAVPRGEERDFGRAGGNSRSVGHERGRLAGPAGEAEGWPAAGPLLRGQPRAAAGSRRALTRPPPGQPGRMPGTIAQAESRRTTALALANRTPRRLVVGDRRAIAGDRPMTSSTASGVTDRGQVGRS